MEKIKTKKNVIHSIILIILLSSLIISTYNIINANILAAESKASGVFNIAGGKRIKIKALAETIMEIIGKKLKIQYDEPQPSDVKYLLADITKASKSFNYKPEFDIEKGLKETVKWFYK